MESPFTVVCTICEFPERVVASGIRIVCSCRDWVQDVGFACASGLTTRAIAQCKSI